MFAQLSRFTPARLSVRSFTIASLIAAGSVCAIGVPSASASLLGAPAGPCDNSALTQPFAPWGDTNQYKLVPGGDFEGSTAGWTLSGGAAVVSTSDSLAINGASGTHSLQLPAGSSAQAPMTCVSAAYPDLRLVARNMGLGATVLVQVDYDSPLLGLLPLPVGAITLSSAWAPTAAMPTLSAVGGLLNGGTANVALRFTELTGTSQIDDVYIDPRMTH